jgi:hypothetical protein
MVTKLANATGFKRVLDLCKGGRYREAEVLLKSLQDEYLAVCEENDALKKQLGEVAEVLDLSERVKFDGRKYWLEEEGELSGPFCQVCYDRDGLLINLQERGPRWECCHCKSIFLETVQEDRPAPRSTAKELPLFTDHEYA